MSNYTLETATALACEVESSDLVDFMLDPAAYPERPNHVECAQTHISWVFLTHRYAYKLKKPVRFEFLDFSTPALRRAACQQEVRLNRRLAPRIYLGVVPINMHLGRLRLGGQGEAVDWVVKMQRLPAARSLDRLVEAHGVAIDDVDRIARTLVDFYERLPPLAVKTQAYREEIAHHVQANRRELLAVRHGLPSAAVERVHEAQVRLLQLHGELLDRRVLDGRIVEGHGDLRPEHIYLTTAPTIIDCIEFSAELRTLDVADELAFLAMECAKLGAPWIGERILDCYRRECRDDVPPRLTAFYKTYRACVRAKVAALRAEQLDGAERRAAIQSARDYLRLAECFAEQFAPPLLIVVRGLSGAGKSTLAESIAQRLGVSLLQTDAVRRDLFGASPQAAEYGEDIYQQQKRLRVYYELLRRADEVLRQGRSVVLDGTFLSADCRREAQRLADARGAEALFVHCTCPREIAQRRIARRLALGGSLSAARVDTYCRQQQEEQPDPADVSTVSVDTSLPLADVVTVAMSRLKALDANSR